MNAAGPVPASPTAVERLAHHLKRSEGLWLPSPSLALLSALVAGPARPSKLLVQDGCPSFVTAIGSLVGATTEVVPLDDSEEPRQGLRSVSSKARNTWGVATHANHSLVSDDWFEAFASAGIPSVELCLGSLFELARRGPSSATVTIVSLDHEPAFAGVRLTALLTDDPALARRVKHFCLAEAGGRSAVLDATPRGLAEDEPALATILERAFARDEEDRSEGPPRKASGRIGVISHVWKRIFRSQPEITQTPGIPPVPLPPGKNSWLARTAALEEEHEAAIGRLRATIESRALELANEKSEDVRSRFQAGLSVLEATLDRVREEAKDDAARVAASHEAALAGLEARIVAVENSRDDALRRLADSLTERDRDTAAHALAAAEAEKGRLALEARALELENLHTEGLTRISRLEDRVAQLTPLHLAAVVERDRVAARLRESEEAHRQALRLAEERMASLRRELQLETSRRSAEAAEADARFEAETLASRQEAGRQEAKHAAIVAGLENQLALVLAQAQVTVEHHARDAASVAEEVSRLKNENTALLARHQEAEARVRAGEVNHKEAQRLAEERRIASERDHAAGISRVNGELAEARALLNHAAKAAVRERRVLEERHAEVVAQLQESLADQRRRGEAASLQHAQSEAALTRRVSELEEQQVAVSDERDELERQLDQMAREKNEETRQLEVFLAESQARFESATRLAATHAERTAAEHRTVTNHLQEELSQLQRRSQARVEEYEGKVRELEKSLSVLEMEGAATMEREMSVQRERQARAEAAWQSRFEAAAAASAHELEQIKSRRDAAEARHQREAEEARKGMAALALSRENEVNGLATRLAEMEREKTARMAEISDLAGRVRRQEEAVAAWRSRFEAAATAAATESQQIEAAHAVIVARLEAKVDQIEKQRDAATMSQQQAEAALTKRLSLLEAERDALGAQIRQMETAQRETLPRVEVQSLLFPREKAEPVARLARVAKETRGSKTRQETRAHPLPNDSSREEVKSRAEASEKAQKQPALTGRLPALERDAARLPAPAETAPVTARREEVSGAREASSAILDERATEPQNVLVGPSNGRPRAHPDATGLAVDEDRDFSDLDQYRWDGSGPAKPESANAESEPDGAFPEWEYEGGDQPSQDTSTPPKLVLRLPRGGVQGWLQGVARRILRE